MLRILVIIVALASTITVDAQNEKIVFAVFITTPSSQSRISDVAKQLLEQ